MKINCAIIDDEPLAIDLLKDYVSKTWFLEMEFSTTNPLEALRKMEEKTVDLVFLDIQMPELNGMDFLKIAGNKTKVILTTAYSDFALESYDYGVIDYLLKPISYERFYKSVQKSKDFFKISETEIQIQAIPEKDSFFVKSDGKQLKILFDGVLFIEGLRDYVNIKTNEKEIIVLENLKDLESVLPQNFMRVHRSFIINLNKISEIDGNRVSVGSQHIPIGETYKNDFKDWLKKQ